MNRSTPTAILPLRRRSKYRIVRKLARLVCRIAHKSHWSTDFYGRHRVCSKCGRSWSRKYSKK